MAMKSKKAKSLKQIEREEYKYYSCDNCKWYNALMERCKLQDCSVILVHCCKLFEVKQGDRDCTQCKHYNKRKNAKSKCKIGIYNCKGVIK